MLGECAKAPTSKACSVSANPDESGGRQPPMSHVQLLIRKHGKGCYRTDFTAAVAAASAFTDCSRPLASSKSLPVETPPSKRRYSRQQVLMQGFTGLKGLVLQGSR